MPTYDYHCDHCGHTTEAFQKITDSPLEQCPNCSNSTLKRGIGGGLATFQFKGDGFYINDSRRSCHKGACDCHKSSES